MATNSWGYRLQDMDKNVRPQDDFFHYAGGGWIKRNSIPKNEVRWGSFLILRYETDKRLRKIVDGLAGNYPKGSPEQMIHDLYHSALNEKKREELGITPLLPWLKKISAVKNGDELINLFTSFEEIGITTPFDILIDQDMKKSSRYIVYLSQSGLGLPEREYYLKKDAEHERIKKAYEKYVSDLFILAGSSRKESMRERDAVLAIETKLAAASTPIEDLRDAEKVYHKYTLAKLKKEMPAISWEAYFKQLGVKNEKEYVVMTPHFIETFSKLLKTIPLEEWKIYARFHVINSAASLLNKKFVRLQFAFYGTVLAGQKAMKPLWRRALSKTNALLGELLGELYVAQYFPPEAKRKADLLIDDLVNAFAERIQKLDWMTPKTKKKALQKLKEITRKIGCPKRWRSYKGLSIRQDDYFGNIVRAAKFEHARMVRKLGKPIDKNEWYMFPQTINAYYNPGLNEIVFPAGILQPPFFSPTVDDAINYGSIGTVIGHELTHAFDDQGAKFDGIGNMRNWWTPIDKKQFEQKTKVLKKQFDSYRVADDVPVNGSLTLGENIADLGGVLIAYDAYQKYLARTKSRKEIDGFTPEQRFFLGFALFDRSIERDEAVKLSVLTDPHSPSIFRVNGPLSNIQEFYEAFNVTAKDTLYRKPSARAYIW